MIKWPDLLRWVGLLVIFIVCLGPPCANFVSIAASTAHGHPLPWASMLHYSVVQEGVIFGSATLIGPIGIAAALWTLSSPAHRLGTTFMVVLWTLTAWATVYVALSAQSAEWRALATPSEILFLLLNLVILPLIGVTLLQRLDTRRRRPAV